MELVWLKDQRTKIGTKGGKFIMGGVDRKEAKLHKKRLLKMKIKMLQLKVKIAKLKS